MSKNFKIYGGVILESQNFSFDIHNDFDLKGLSINLFDKELNILFERFESDWINGDLPIKFELEFKNFKTFNISKNFFSSSDLTVDQIGYKEKDDTNMDWLIEEENFQEGFDYVIRLMNDEFLRINAANV